MQSLEDFLFNIDIPTGSPSQGALLIAEPFLKESYFNHSVICLTEHNPKGSVMGVVLNHQLPVSLRKTIDGITRTDKIPVYCGGPMSRDRLFFIHTLPEIIPDGHEIIDGLFISGDFDAMRRYVNSGGQIEGKIRFFVGYSGWTGLQLDEEISNNVWAVSSFKNASNLLRGSGDTFWHRYVRLMGERYRGWQYHPINPLDN